MRLTKVLMAVQRGLAWLPEAGCGKKADHTGRAAGQDGHLDRVRTLAIRLLHSVRRLIDLGQCNRLSTRSS
jgi:hypothetical protein